MGPAPTAPALDNLPRLSFVAPKLDEEVGGADADLQVRLSVEDWPLELEGTHLHFVLDEGRGGQTTVWPAGRRARFEAAFPMSSLTKQQPLAPGEHVLVAFACRKAHESIKGEEGLSVVRFWIGTKAAEPIHSPDQPMLVLFHPQPQYEGGVIQSILVDFYLYHAALGEGRHSVELSISEGLATPQGPRRSIRITEWRPYLIGNLRPVQKHYTVTLQLYDPSGRPVLSPWGSASQAVPAVHR